MSGSKRGPKPQPGGFRQAHGRAAECGRLTASETPALEELLPPSASGVEPDQGNRTPDGRFTAGNTVSRKRKHRPGRDGALAHLHAKADPSWQAAQRWGQSELRKRLVEIQAAHGEVSAGVRSMLSTWADCLADAKWLRAKGAESGEPDLFKLAAQLGAQARGAQRDAWQLAALEAQARPKRPTGWQAPNADQAAALLADVEKRLGPAEDDEG